MCFLLFFINGSAQSNEKQHLLLDDVENLMYSNPDEALKIAQHLLSKTNVTNEEKAKINFLISKAYEAKGDISSSLSFLYEEKNYLEFLSGYEFICIELKKIEELNNLFLFEEANKTFNNLQEKFSNVEDVKVKLFLESSFVLEKAKGLLKNKSYDGGINILLNQRKKNKKHHLHFNELENNYSIILGKLYLQKLDLLNAGYQFQKVLSNLKATNSQNLFLKIQANLGLSDVISLNKNYISVSVLLDNALKDAYSLSNKLLQSKIIKKQCDNYLALNDVKNYKFTNEELVKKYSQVDVIVQETTNSVYNIISDDYLANYKNNSKYYDKLFFIFLLLILIICSFYLVLLQKQNVEKRKLNEIVNYLEITRNNIVAKYKENKNEPKKVSIHKETEELLLAKLKRFENSKKFLNKDISLSVLAGQLDTNTKYLSEIINSHYQVNFNSYINKLRINYIVEMLKTDSNFSNYKISYLAENCGFSSHSTFATVFKSIAGISPITFIELLNTEKENSNKP